MQYEQHQYFNAIIAVASIPPRWNDRNHYTIPHLMSYKICSEHPPGLIPLAHSSHSGGEANGKLKIVCQRYKTFLRTMAKKRHSKNWRNESPAIDPTRNKERSNRGGNNHYGVAAIFFFRWKHKKCEMKKYETDKKRREPAILSSFVFVGSVCTCVYLCVCTLVLAANIDQVSSLLWNSIRHDLSARFSSSFDSSNGTFFCRSRHCQRAHKKAEYKMMMLWYSTKEIKAFMPRANLSTQDE